MISSSGGTITYRTGQGMLARTRLHPLVPVPVFRTPDLSQPISLLSPQVVAEWPTWVPVEGGRPGWALVSLPWVPYGGSGWVRLDARVAVVPLWTTVEIDSTQRTVTLAERGRRRIWPARLVRNSLTPRGRSLVLGEVTSELCSGRSGLLVAAHVLTDDSGGLELGGAHRWAALIHDSALSGGVRVPPDALFALLAAAPAGTSVLIH